MFYIEAGAIRDANVGIESHAEGDHMAGRGVEVISPLVLTKMKMLPRRHTGTRGGGRAVAAAAAGTQWLKALVLTGDSDTKVESLLLADSVESEVFVRVGPIKVDASGAAALPTRKPVGS